MAATIPDLGARVLRRLGIAIVAAGERPAFGSTVPAATIAERALRVVGVNPVGAAGLAAPADAIIVPVAEIALRALHDIGANPIGAANHAPNDLTSFTAEQVAVRVLQRLGVVAADEAPAAADILVVADQVRAVHASLNSLGIVNWANNETRQWAVEQTVIMTAQLAAPGFGKPADMGLYAAAQEVLRLEALSGRNGDLLAQDRVRFVHDALRAKGMVAWDVGAIPQECAEDYVKLTAIALAPVYGKPMDLAAVPALEGRIAAQALAGQRGQAIALEKVLAVHDALNAQGLVDWTEGNVPLSMAEDYVLLVANLLAPIYGKPVADPAPMEGRIRKASMLRRAPAIAEQAVLDVHVNLDARGKTRWTVFDIPDYAENPYVLLAANLVGPQFGMAVDPMAEVRAIRELAQVISLRSSGERTVAEYF